jgi:hypothetical protein
MIKIKTNFAIAQPQSKNQLKAQFAIFSIHFLFALSKKYLQPNFSFNYLPNPAKSANCDK